MSHIVTATSIPEELRDLAQWVAWLRQIRGDRLTKVPYDARTGSRAATNDPSTWSSFEAAWRALAGGPYDGVGFVFTTADRYIGIDLDKVRDPAGGKLEPWAQEIVARLDSYTEVSPSGTGLHCIAQGVLPPGGRRKGRVEMYDTGRYFTMTGHVLDGRTTIQERTSVLAAVHAETFEAASCERPSHPIASPVSHGSGEDEIVRRATRAANGAAFAALWRGDRRGYDSHSEADMALCAHLAFWTGKDPERIDRLFRRSGLYRPKWDERHYGDGRTYGQATVMKALVGSGTLRGTRSAPVTRVYVADRDAPTTAQTGTRPTFSEMSEGASRITVEVA